MSNNNKNIHKGGKVKSHLRHFRIAILDNKEIHRSEKGIGSARASISMKANPIDAAKKLLSSISKHQGLKKMKRLKCNAIFSIKETTKGHSKIYGPYKGKFVNLMKNGKEKIVKLKTGVIIKYSLKPVVKKYKEKNYKNVEMKVSKIMKGGDLFDPFVYNDNYDTYYINHKLKICCIALIEYYNKIALGNSDGTIDIFDIKYNRHKIINLTGAHTKKVTSIAVFGEGKKLVSSSLDGSIAIWDIDTGSCLNTFKGYKKATYSVDVINNGENIISNGNTDHNYIFKKWNLNGDLILEWENEDYDRYVTVIENGEKIISYMGDDKDIRIWNTYIGECVQTFSGHTDDVLSVAVNLERSQIISSSKDRTVKIWDLKSKNKNKNLINTITINNMNNNIIDFISVKSNGRIIVLCQNNGIIKYFDQDEKSFKLLHTEINNKEESLFSVNKNDDRILRVINEHKGIKCGIIIYGIAPIYSQSHSYYNTRNKLKLYSLSSLALFNNNNNFILYASNEDNKIRLFDIITRKYTRTFYIDQNNKNNKYHSNSISISNDDSYFVSANSNNTITIFDKKMEEDWKNSLDVFITLIGHSGPVMSIAIINERKYIVSGSSDNTIKLWDLNKTEEHCINTFLGHTGSVNSIEVGWYGLSFVSGSSDNTIKLWDLNKQELIKTLLGHTGPVMSVKLIKDGEKIVSGSSDKTIRIWDSFSGNCIKTLFGHTNSVNTISVIFNGEIISSGSSDNTIKVWRYGKCVQTLYEEKDVKSIALSKDGHYIASNNTIWDIDVDYVDGNGMRLLNYISNKIKEEEKEEEEAKRRYHPSQLKILNRSNYPNYIGPDNIDF